MLIEGETWKIVIGDPVFLKVSPLKGVMGFGKLAPRYVGLFEIHERIGAVT